MSHELLGLYQKIREAPALAVDFPKETAIVLGNSKALVGRK